jgi:hypothetical protein
MLTQIYEVSTAEQARPPSWAFGERDITRCETLAHIPAERFDGYLLDADAPSYEGCIEHAAADSGAFRSAHAAKGLIRSFAGEDGRVHVVGTGPA